jgi:hydroxypyruvate isomerase
VNCSILLTDLPLLERPAAAKAAGFDAVEFWWPFTESVPADKEIDEFVGALRDAGLVSWPARSQEFLDNLDVVAGIGERTGCRAFNALYGNRQDGETAETQDELGVENLVRACRAVQHLGGTVLLEPVSGADAYPLKTARDALAIIGQVRQNGADNLKLLADFYHLAVNGDDVEAVIENHAPEFGHIQIADAPGRNEPGTGNLPLQQWINLSRQRGYSGYVGLEYKASRKDPFTWIPTWASL